MDEFNLATGAHISPLDPNLWTLASVGAPVQYPDSCKIDLSWRTASMQNQIGCCVGCTGEECVAQIVHNLTRSTEELSYRFVYALAKGMDGLEEQGTYPSLVASIIKNYGVPLAKFCPNESTLDHETFVFNRKMKDKNSIIATLGQEAYDDAQTRKVGAYFTVPLTQDGIKQAVTYANNNNGLVMILRSVGNTYWTDAEGNLTWDKDKILPVRTPMTITSGHEESLYGYDLEPKTNRLRIYWLNHWSPKWADNGRGWEYADAWLPLIKEIRVVVAALPPAPPTFSYHFANTLSKGMKGADIVALQHVLSLQGCFPSNQKFTGYFGDITFKSVILFQEKYRADILTPVGLEHGTGFVGQRTLAKLNSLYSS